MVDLSYSAVQFLHFAALVGQAFDGDASFPPLMQVSRFHGRSQSLVYFRIRFKMNIAGAFCNFYFY